MTKTLKWIIVAASLILIGGIIFIGGMAMSGWSFENLFSGGFITNKYDITENYKNVWISATEADIKFVPCEGIKTTIECYERENALHTVRVHNDTLSIELVDNRKWYEHISINFETPKIKVYIPKGDYAELSIKSHTGDTQIPTGLTFESMNVVLTTGDIEVAASAKGEVNIKTTTGNIKAKNLIAQNVELSVSTGDVKLNDINCESLTATGSTGDCVLKNVIAKNSIYIERSTGDIKFDSADAAEIYAKTSTGDIWGTLLSEKVFLASSDTGSVNVPKTVTGGRCELVTDTGDIKIEIK